MLFQATKRWDRKYKEGLPRGYLVRAFANVGRS